MFYSNTYKVYWVVITCLSMNFSLCRVVDDIRDAEGPALHILSTPHFHLPAKHHTRPDRHHPKKNQMQAWNVVMVGTLL